MEIIITIIILSVLCYIVLLRYGSLSFWKKAKKNPDFVYDQIMHDNAWFIYDGVSEIDKNKFCGPFILYVPSINKTIKIYGEYGKFEDSQKRIAKEL